jgi:hypothetical protein
LGFFAGFHFLFHRVSDAVGAVEGPGADSGWILFGRVGIVFGWTCG